MKMLICDDDSMTLRALEFQFRKDGFEMFKAINGREAQKILNENSDIDVLVTDIYMPLMNGLELVTYVRKTLRRNIPIVVVSIVNVEEIILQAFELGASEYLTKPFNLADLSNRVKHLLKQ
jgi:DNA-binding response OmpR family regulator